LKPRRGSDHLHPACAYAVRVAVAGGNEFDSYKVYRCLRNGKSPERSGLLPFPSAPIKCPKALPQAAQAYPWTPTPPTNVSQRLRAELDRSSRFGPLPNPSGESFWDRLAGGRGKVTRDREGEGLSEWREIFMGLHFGLEILSRADLYLTLTGVRSNLVALLASDWLAPPTRSAFENTPSGVARTSHLFTPGQQPNRQPPCTMRVQSPVDSPAFNPASP
jgi:hypothetical protein